MGYTEQLKALTDAIGSEAIIEALINGTTDQTQTGAQLSKDSDGNLSAADITMIQNL